MLKLIILAIGILIAAILAIAAFRPDSFRVERSARIKAAPARIFPLIDDLQAFRRWSPFEKQDPDMKRSFSGPAGGAGAVYDFDGNREIGAGRLTITDSSPDSLVAMTLDMTRPMKVHNLITFTLTPDGDSTRVTWAMQGRNNFLSKLLGMFMDMEGMCGQAFESGLTSLKTIAEDERPRSLTDESPAVRETLAAGNT